MLENAERGLHMNYSGLLSPRAVSCDLGAFLHCNGEILVPAHFPVRHWSLVEENGANREGAVTQNGLDETSDNATGC